MAISIYNAVGFDWDEGNRTKCQKHGVAPSEIEAIFASDIAVRPNLHHSLDEFRYQAIARTGAGRHLFMVFTLRERDGQVLIRPISARFMHKTEIARYEKENPGL